MRFAWHFVHCEIPEDWELLRYSLDPRVGELAFATRAGWQARFAWKATRKGDIPEAWTPLPAAEGRCFERREPSLGLIFTWSFEAAAVEVAEAIVASTRVWKSGEREITLHGIHARYPENYVPVKVVVHPANVLLALEAPDRSRRVWRRFGLPDAVLQGQTPREFLRRLLQSEGLRIEKIFVEKGQDIAEISGRGLTPLARLLFRRATGRARIWLEDDKHRLCTYEELA